MRNVFEIFNELFLLLFISLNNHHIISSHICNHIPPKPDEIGFVNLQSEHKINKRSAQHNLRIAVHYDKSVHELPEDKFSIINETVLPQALDFWQKALKVRPLQVPIKLSRKCPENKIFFPPSTKPSHQHCIEYCLNNTTCGEVVVPQEHLDVCRVCNRQGSACRKDIKQPPGEGVIGSDFVLYVSAIQTDRCEKGATVAYASHCQQESQFDRPIAGHANLCPKSISTKRQDLDTLSSTIKHEIIHALGFSISLYAYFRDQKGNPLTPREQDSRPKLDEKLHIPQWSEKIVKTIRRKNWLVRSGMITKDVHMFVTPRVVEEVRKHFNCSELEGAELEDQGEDGTTLTHWEKRVFENEAMTGTHTQNPVYSRITLALLEDTGWYYPNYEMAQPLKWGKNLGCNFAMKSCKEWIDRKRKARKSIHPFCEKVKREPLETECTDYRDAVALCNLKRYPDELSKEYQNFDSIKGVESKELGHYGGSVSLADYCPYIQEFTWRAKDVVVRGSQCQFTENNPSLDKNFALEYYGPDSKCFNHVDKWEERTCFQSRHWQHWGSGCYQYECFNGRINLIIANFTYTCYFPEQEIRIQRFVDGWLHIGTVICPKCNEICLDMKCRDEKPKKVIFAPNEKLDELKCSSTKSASLYLLNVLSLLISFFYIS